ncbi:hypothetical protein CHU92_08615 [Flavobacterium cyanobacteriorum]|uniref:Fibronectin type-III domain-containing protein n=1 Tax=Flavobacterium cyanobacteriorum TaxID=2022802 RepID=A0A255Z738_9FLAO|nr:fibronectin type III domain-containing protein [Flavobacterium cyanobacteriorum]OYQ37242.1 hypothetical protein CHU92_08615 [Flavobacterium cyanobacteriorum]
MNQNYQILDTGLSVCTKSCVRAREASAGNVGFTFPPGRSQLSTGKVKHWAYAALVLFLLTFSTQFSYAQAVSGYSFATGTSGTLDPMSGSAQLVASASDDGVSAVTSIGFTFNYAGTNYTQFSANANGLVRLGATVVTDQWTNSAANAATASPVIMPYWDDLHTGTNAGGGRVHTVLIGTAPNRIRIIEWFVTVPRSSSAAANARFQAWLYETTNVVQFVYGNGMVINSTNSGATIGLATSATVFNTVVAATNTASSTVFTTNNTDAITAGRTYTFTPPVQCSGTPVAGTIPASFGVCSGGTPPAVTATGVSNDLGITYQWEESDDNGVADAWANAVGGTGATTTTYTPPALSSNRFYRLRVTCTNSSQIAYTSAVQYSVTVCTYDVARNTGVTYNSIMATGNTFTWSTTSSTPAVNSSWQTDENTSTQVTFPFPFTYRGTSVTGFRAHVNGFVTLSNAALSSHSAFTTGIGSTGTWKSVIAPFWADLVTPGNPNTVASLQASNAPIKYAVSGVSPNRVLTIEWAGMEVFQNAGPNLNFQVKFYETSNNIEFVYGTMEGFNGTLNTTYSYATGLNGENIVTANASNLTSQQLANTRSFAATAVNNLNVPPQCNTSLLFTPGTYTAYVPPASTIPVNNDPAGAIALSLNVGPCTSYCNTYYNTSGATATTGITACTATTPGSADDDVWFQFVATDPNITIQAFGGGGYDAVLQLFSDAGTTSVACSNAFGNGLTETISATGLTPGQTYYVRVYHASSGNGTTPLISICASTLVPPPSNNDPCGAVALTPSGTTCTPYTDSMLPSTTSILNATTTTSNGVVAPTCTGAATNVNDVWFKFTATSTTHGATVTAVPGFDVAVQAYSITSGSCNGNDLVLNPISCINNGSTGITEQVIFTTVAGQEYYVRVYRHPSGTSGNPVDNSQFSICIFSPVPSCTTNSSPANAATGTSLTPTLNWASAQYATSYDIYLGTQSGPTTLLTNVTTTSYTLTAGQALNGLTQYFWYVVPKNVNGAPACGAANQTSFTTQTACRVPTAVTVGNLDTTALTVDLSWTAPTAGPAPTGYEYAFTTSATPPASGTFTTDTSVTGQTIVAGTAYYLHVRTSCGGGDFSAWATSTIYRYNLGDTCATALDLATLTSPYVGTTVNFNNDALPSCGSSFTTTAPDAYFSIVVPKNYTLNINITASSYDNTHTLAYGTCGSLTEIVCRDTDVTNETWTNTTNGSQTVYWIQDGWGSGSGTFTLTWNLVAPPPCVPPTGLTPVVTGTSALVSWTASDSNPANGYQYEIRTSGAAGSGATGLTASGTVTGLGSNPATGLTIGTTYTVYVRSLCSAEESSTWASATFTVRPANDNCINATAIACGDSVTSSTTGATNDNMAICGISGVTSQSTAGVWYKFTGDGRDVTLSTCSASSGDTRLNVYTGSCGSMTCVAGNDDNAGCTIEDLSSEVLIRTTIGTEYYVLVHAYSSGTSSTNTVNFQLSMTCVTPCTPETTNDECATATALTVGVPLATNNTCATANTNIASPSCGSSFATYYDSWYSFNSGSNTTLEVSAIPTGTAAVGYILYSGACGSLTPVTGSCFTGGAANNVTLTANTNYFIRVYSTTVLGRGDFTLTVKVPCPRPTGVASSAITTNTATISWIAPTTAPSGGYQYEVRTSGNPGSGVTGLAASGATNTLSANLTGLAPDTTHSVYVRSVCGEGDFSPWTSVVTFATVPTCYRPTGVASSNVTATTATISWVAPTQLTPTNGYQWEVRTSGAAGSGDTGLFGTSTATGLTANLVGLAPSTTYSVYVRSVCDTDNRSNWTTAVTFTTRVANDVCSGAITVSCGNTISGTTVNSTNDNMAVCGISSITTQNSAGVWYKFVGNGSLVTFSTCSPTQTDTRMAVYTGTCGALTCVGGNDDNSACTTANLSSEVQVNTTAGTTYYILVFAFVNTSTVSYNFTVTCAPPCTPAAINNECANAQTVLVGTTTASNNACSTASTGVAFPSCGSSFATYYDTWFEFNSGANTSVTVSTTATAPTAIGYAVYSGACGTLTQIGCNSTGAVSTISGLTPFTVYYIRAYSTTLASRGSFSVTIGTPCNTPTGVTTTSTLESVTTTWTAPLQAPGNGYQYEIRTSGGAGSGATGLVFGGNVPGTSVTTLGLTPNTNYSVYVRSACSATDFSGWTTAVTAFTGYCTPAPSSVAGSGITNVTFGTVNNTTTTETGNYGNYATLVGSGERTQSLNVSVSYGSTAHFTKIWVDWNDDLDFNDAGEAVFSSTSAQATAAASFVIPQSAPLGNHRMRIGGRTTSATFDACFTGTNASFEDYTLNVTTQSTVTLLSSSCTAVLTSYNQILYATALPNVAQYRFRVRNGNVIGEVTTSNSLFRMNMLPSGIVPATLTYGQTYAIDVAINRNGVWSDYGPACRISTPSVPPSTQLTICNMTVDTFGTLIYANPVSSATAYRFRVVSSEGTYFVDNSAQWFTLKMLPQYSYGTTYTVSVSVLAGGVWSSYGSSCQVTTRATLPATQLMANSCGITGVTPGQLIYANSVALAQSYTFTVTSPLGTQSITTPNNYITLKMLNNFDYNVTFTITVTANATGFTSTPGNACTVTSVAAPATTQLRAVDCGATVANRRTSIFANGVHNVAIYRFRVTTSTNQVYIVDRTNTEFRLKFLPSNVVIPAGATVTIDIMTISPNGSQSAYGPACQVTLSNTAGRPSADAGEEDDVKITTYPNPFTETFAVDFTTESQEMIHIVVYDMAGKLVDRLDIEAAQLPGLKLGGNLAAGVYNLIVTQGETVKTLRVIKNVN